MKIIIIAAVIAIFILGIMQAWRFHSNGVPVVATVTALEKIPAKRKGQEGQFSMLLTLEFPLKNGEKQHVKISGGRNVNYTVGQGVNIVYDADVPTRVSLAGK